MNLLLIHQNFPGQFRYIAQDLSRSQLHRVLAIGRDSAPGLPEFLWCAIDLHGNQPHRRMAI